MKKTITPVVLMVLFLAAWPGAQELKIGPASGRKHILENGLTLLLNRDESSATTVIQILVRGGQLAEPAGKQGLAYLTTRLSLDISDESEARDMIKYASTCEVSSAGDHSLIRIRCLTSLLEKTLDILSGVIRKPLFSGIRIDRIREFMIHFGRKERDDAVKLGHWTALAAFFGATGYGGFPLGNEQTLKSLKGREISEFHKRHFTGERMIISASSDLKEDDLLAILKKYFSGFGPGGAQLPSAAGPIVPEKKEWLVEKDAKQAFISRAFALPAISPRGYVLAFLLEYLLGPRPGSRLWPIRAEDQLAYNINSKVTAMKDAGLLEAYLETDRTKAETARLALRAVLNRLYQEGVGEDEFLRLRIGARAEFTRLNEPRDIRSENLAKFEAWGLGQEFLSGFDSVLNALTPLDFEEFIKTVLKPESAVEVVVGPAESAGER